MAFVYHMVPAEMQGDTLYPLNQLKDRHPDLYTRQMAKYNDHPTRQSLPQRTIPILGCLWNDVVQCAPIHPHHIYKAWLELGKTLPPIAWYCIPTDAFAHLPAVIMQSRQNTDPVIPEADVERFDARAYRELDTLPQAALDWYAQLAAQGRMGAWFVGIPHILFHGPINVRTASVITWDQTP